ncbi:MAG: DUF4416 family protein [Desulfobacteraceae bacterium]|nr:DUF4416 family protein [Desulfobacteraceae bacterium]
MSLPQTPKPAKLLIGFFLNDRTLADSVVRKLKAAFSNIDLVSPWFEFDYTSYYTSEMGSPLFRRVLGFSKLVPQEDLADIKLLTNEIELSFTKNTHRQVNIDPGILSPERFVLATGKNFTHRIYIGKRMFADLTLIYRKNSFKTLPWTYPDYAAAPMLDFLWSARKKYLVDLAFSSP